MVVAFGDDDHEPRIAAIGEPSVRRNRYEVDVDARREHGEHWPAVEVDTCRRSGRRLAEVVDLDGRWHRLELGGTHQRRVGHGPGPEPPLGREAVVGMKGRGPSAVPLHGGDDPSQRVSRRLVAVDDALGLAVVLADADLEHRPVLVDGRTCNLEPEDLGAEDSVLDDRFGAGGSDDVYQGVDPGVERWLGGQWLRFGRRQHRAVDAPDLRRIAERRGAAGEHTRRLVDEEMEIFDTEPLGPQQGAPQRPLRLVVGQNPNGAVGDRGGAAGKALRPAFGVAPLALDEGAQLGLAKALVPPGVDYFLFPLRAP